jgi:hypothetical protein
MKCQTRDSGISDVVIQDESTLLCGEEKQLRNVANPVVSLLFDTPPPKKKPNPRTLSQEDYEFLLQQLSMQENEKPKPKKSNRLFYYLIGIFLAIFFALIAWASTKREEKASIEGTCPSGILEQIYTGRKANVPLLPQFCSFEDAPSILIETNVSEALE